MSENAGMLRLVTENRLYNKLVLFFLVVIMLTYVLHLNNISKFTYYSYEEPLGPLSNTAILVFYIVAVSSMIFFMCIFKSIEVAIAIFLVALMVKYLLPQYFDYVYIQNFYDVESHMLRGAYVTITGRSDPKVDMYFDVQPGFFWWTAIYINIVFGPQVSLNSVVFEFFMKWFNIVATMLYLPILIFFFRKLGLNLKNAFLGCVCFILLSLSRHHYSAQAFSWVIYWCILAMYIEPFKNNKVSLNSYIPPVITITSLVFVHQGTTFFTFIALISFLFYILISELLRIHRTHYHRSRKYVLFSIVYLFLSWLIYLMYITIHTFGNFITTLNNVVQTIIQEGLPKIITTAITRYYEKWQYIVYVKSIYMVLGVIVCTLLFFIKFLKGEKLSMLLLIHIIFLSIVIGSIAFALGGAGYVERIHEAVTPLIVFSLLANKENTHKIISTYRKGLEKLIYVIILTILCVLGSVLYFSGWNFQSIAYSELAGRYFLISAGPTVENIYPDKNACIRPLFYPEYPYKKISDGMCIYIERFHNNIQAVYYLLGDFTAIEQARSCIWQEFNIIYSSPTTLVYLVIEAMNADRCIYLVSMS